ncbi:arylamine N-acetyltransferase family protein [Melghirimyces algeriensis]|uniref:N-hydroxyarylamine O-acetyltransferase n=1 Tax=Melghirimyces algeriensis TaxID=910412 RepID=A0A521DJ53_9BACL|nr:arylamine N-acetyltransferase [Melghirimyces algeriensis]SMO70960.1 N-hydroxyarylamine O-acetyltransferase [Melghirimyces algeriensis]
MDVKAYLKRIQVDSVGKPNLETLQYLMNQHLFHIPFENLDILCNRWIRLQHGAVFKKIVYQKRGGFCYELNSAFSALLQELGFQVSIVSGRVRTADGGFGPEYDHMALIVHLNEPWLVDVGFGDSARQPLPLSGKKQSDLSGCYRIKKIPNEKEAYVLEKKQQSRWVSSYRFSTTARRLRDFAVMCAYHQTSPTSIFRQQLILTRATLQGRISLSDDSFIHTIHGQKRKIPVQNIDVKRYLMYKHFGIDPDSIPLHHISCQKSNKPGDFSASSFNESISCKGRNLHDTNKS